MVLWGQWDPDPGGQPHPQKKSISQGDHQCLLVVKMWWNHLLLVSWHPAVVLTEDSEVFLGGGTCNRRGFYTKSCVSNKDIFHKLVQFLRQHPREVGGSWRWFLEVAEPADAWGWWRRLGPDRTRVQLGTERSFLWPCWWRSRTSTCTSREAKFNMKSSHLLHHLQILISVLTEFRSEINYWSRWTLKYQEPLF